MQSGCHIHLVRIQYETCHINLEQFQHEGNYTLNQIIAVGETWARAYEPELKRQSNEWHRHGSPWRHKFRQNTSPTKVMIILAYDSQGVLECHPVRESCTINATYYRSFLQYNLRRTDQRKRPTLVNNAVILHGNAASHTAAVVQHPPYSPDISPCDSFQNWRRCCLGSGLHIDASRTADDIQHHHR